MHYGGASFFSPLSSKQQLDTRDALALLHYLQEESTPLLSSLEETPALSDNQQSSKSFPLHTEPGAHGQPKGGRNNDSGTKKNLRVGVGWGKGQAGVHLTVSIWFHPGQEVWLSIWVTRKSSHLWLLLCEYITLYNVHIDKCVCVSPLSLHDMVIFIGGVNSYP